MSLRKVRQKLGGSAGIRPSDMVPNVTPHQSDATRWTAGLIVSSSGVAIEICSGKTARPSLPRRSRPPLARWPASIGARRQGSAPAWWPYSGTCGRGRPPACPLLLTCKLAPPPNSYLGPRFLGFLACFAHGLLNVLPCQLGPQLGPQGGPGLPFNRGPGQAPSGRYQQHQLQQRRR